MILHVVADLHSKILDARPPPGPNSFNFMQFLGKFGKSYVGAPPWRVGAPSSGKSWIRHCHLKYVSKAKPVFEEFALDIQKKIGKIKACPGF